MSEQVLPGGGAAASPPEYTFDIQIDLIAFQKNIE